MLMNFRKRKRLKDWWITEPALMLKLKNNIGMKASLHYLNKSTFLIEVYFVAIKMKKLNFLKYILYINKGALQKLKAAKTGQPLCSAHRLQFSKNKIWVIRSPGILICNLNPSLFRITRNSS